MRARSTLAVLIAVALLGSGCGLTASDVPVPGGGVSGDSYELTTVFTDALNLPVKAKVKEGGVTIGIVERLSVDGYDAKVQLAIQADHRIPRGATFQLRQTSALGEVYVAVTSPTSAPDGYWEAGDTVGEDQTGEAPGVEDTLAALSMLTNGGGISQLTTILRESETALAGNASGVGALLDQVTSVLGALDRRTASINKILDSAAHLTVTVNERKATVQSVFTDIAPAARVLAAQTRQLVTLLKRLDALARSGSGAITAVGADARRLMRSLGPALDGFLAMDKDLHGQFTTMLAFSDRVMRFLPGDAAAGILQIAGIIPDGTPSGPAPGGGSPVPPVPGIPDLLGLDGLLSTLLPGTTGATR